MNKKTQTSKVTVNIQCCSKNSSRNLKTKRNFWMKKPKKEYLSSSQEVIRRKRPKDGLKNIGKN